MQTLKQLAEQILLTADPSAKARASLAAASAWRNGELDELGMSAAPDRPARPERPELLAPREMPRRQVKGHRGRIALLHAIAHIELNAIDLAWDLLVRFADKTLPPAFVDDWTAVAADEARHFLLLQDRLTALGIAYGDLPAHDGLWQAARATAHDLLARLAVVPLVLEARGLDVTPAMIDNLKTAGDEISAEILSVILEEEIGHVATGMRWFRHVCAQRNLTPEVAWQELVGLHCPARLKPPFNHQARLRASFPAHFYSISDRTTFS